MLEHIYSRVMHVLSATCLVYALAIGPAFGALGCESREALRPDFAAVKDKLVRTLEAHDTSYFDRLLAPGIAFDGEGRVRAPLRLIEGKPSKYGTPRIIGEYLPRLRGSCSADARWGGCSVFRVFEDPDIGEWTWQNGRDDLVARGAGACGRDAPNIAAPIIARVEPGQHVNLPGGKLVETQFGTWAQYTYESGFVYFNVRELSVPRDNLFFGWIGFRKIGGLWRIVNIGRDHL